MIQKFTLLNEARQTTIKFIVETKKKIKELDSQISGMVAETKTFLMESDINEVLSDEGVKIVYLKDATSRPSFQKVFDAVKYSIPTEVQVILEKEYEKQTKESKSIMFG